MWPRYTYPTCASACGLERWEGPCAGKQSIRGPADQETEQGQVGHGYRHSTLIIIKNKCLQVMAGLHEVLAVFPNPFDDGVTWETLK